MLVLIYMIVMCLFIQLLLNERPLSAEPQVRHQAQKGGQ